MGLNPFDIFGLFLGTKGALDQRSAEKKAAADRAAVGKLEARQFVNELFLAKAQAIDASIQRQRQATDIESQTLLVLVLLKEKIDLLLLF